MCVCVQHMLNHKFEGARPPRFETSKRARNSGREVRVTECSERGRRCHVVVVVVDEVIMGVWWVRANGDEDKCESRRVGRNRSIVRRG